MNDPNIPERVLAFIAHKIDTVPELEALLLLWQERDKCWRPEEIAERLYVARDVALAVLRALHSRQLALHDSQTGLYRYSAEWDASGTLMAEVADTYRHNLVRVATLIHSRASSAVREFARAFEWKTDR
jgi:hypothetical protein